jgi:ABC-type Fe3+-siderophore transport system permease subunit
MVMVMMMMMMMNKKKKKKAVMVVTMPRQKRAMFKNTALAKSGAPRQS